MNTLKHVVITGGGSGLGLGLAVRYLVRGASVSILDLNLNDNGRDTLEAAVKLGHGRWQFLPADVTCDDDVADAVNKAVALFGTPQLAINSAGIVLNKTVSDMTAEDFRRVIDVNLNGSFNFASAILPTMAPGSRLALVSSLAGITSNYAYSAYGASKFGVIGLATTLRYEYEPQGIQISCICPPEVNTPLVDGERVHGNPVSLELKKIAGSMQPDEACDQMVRGLDAGRWLIVPGASGKATAFAARYLPGPFHGFMMNMVKRTLKRFPLPQ